jgi:hypothetical protein
MIREGEVPPLLNTVEADSPGSISVRHAVHLRYPAAVGPPAPGRIKDLLITTRVTMMNSPLKTCAVPGTTRLRLLALPAALVSNAIIRNYESGKDQRRSVIEISRAKAKEQVRWIEIYC